MLAEAVATAEYLLQETPKGNWGMLVRGDFCKYDGKPAGIYLGRTKTKRLIAYPAAGGIAECFSENNAKYANDRYVKIESRDELLYLKFEPLGRYLYPPHVYLGEVSEKCSEPGEIIDDAVHALANRAWLTVFFDTIF